ncbi:hypothetical protein [Mesorhizobium sp.]|uniref:hypothetical protein n=1 Tax=Mesorhizobium sp. TaxID=1871066 RepID=UPI000FE5B0D6|nr:hypothetical protein [Mesorhizobium sp.]RWK53520.1 MAG: hypothetical protein EOR48_22225 [Mesorhizobium sp.]
MTVIEMEGGFVVVDGDKVLAGPFPTSAEAWRAADRMEGSPISPAEKRADNKILSSGPAPIAPKKKTKQQRKMMRAAAAAPGWLRAGVAAVFVPADAKTYRDFKLGTFGPASPVRKIDPADYLALKEQSS